MQVPLFIHSVEKGRTLSVATYASTWTPAFFDVYLSSSEAAVVLDEPVRVGTRGIYVDIETGTGGNCAAVVAGSSYLVRVKDIVGTSPTNSAVFTLVISASITDQLRRLLAYAGENLVVDSYDFDAAGNMTEYRVRGFDTAANAADATLDFDGEDMEPGELFRTLVTQGFAEPRSLRSSHVSALDELTTEG